MRMHPYMDGDCRRRSACEKISIFRFYSYLEVRIVLLRLVVCLQNGLHTSLGAKLIDLPPKKQSKQSRICLQEASLHGPDMPFVYYIFTWVDSPTPCAFAEPCESRHLRSWRREMAPLPPPIKTMMSAHLVLQAPECFPLPLPPLVGP